MNAVITNPINLVIIIIGTFLGVFLGFFLLFNKSVKNKANIYLGLLVLLSLTYFGEGFLFRFDLMEKFPHFIGSHKVVNFLIGPLTYLYVRACTQKDFEMRPILWLHFLPFAADFLYNLPFYLQSSSEKVAYFSNLVQTGDTQKPYWFLVLVVIHGIAYFIIAARLLGQYKQHLSNKTSAIDHAFHRWVFVFIAIHAMPLLLVATAFLFSSHGRFTMLLSLFGFFTFSIAVFLAIMGKPELFHAFPHQILPPESPEEQKQKYESSKLQAIQKEQYIEKLQTYVIANKPFLEPELTLAQLSEQVKIPAHYLSQVINEKLNCNFLDYINSYRVEEAKAKLTDAKLSHYTILSIAYEAGFNAKSTFYAVFKKHARMTPSQYRKKKKTAA